MAAHVERKLFKLTAVYYAADEPVLGFLLAGFSLAPVFLVVAYVACFAATGDARIAASLIFQLANVGLNLLLKRIIRQKRPETPGIDQLGDHGMPSNHAQFVGFFAIFAILALRAGSLRPLPSLLLGSAALSLALLCAVSRVHLGYHTTAQVVAGLLVGAVAACIASAALQGTARALQRAIDRVLPEYRRWLLDGALRRADASDVTALERRALELRAGSEKREQ